MDGVRLGPVDDPATDMGSLISLPQRDKVAAMVEAARQAGATIVRGGRIPDGPLGRAAYYEPTLITDAAQDSPVVQREIFGPVLVCLPFDGDDDAIRLANDSPYGLAASAWTGNVFRAGRASRVIQAGCVWINDHIPIISVMPHGGYKAAGFGKDMSAYSFDEYTNVKHVMSEITASSTSPGTTWSSLSTTSGPSGRRPSRSGTTSPSSCRSWAYRSAGRRRRWCRPSSSRR